MKETADITQHSGGKASQLPKAGQKRRAQIADIVSRLLGDKK
jgi:hypothetical protein